MQRSYICTLAMGDRLSLPANHQVIQLQNSTLGLLSQTTPAPTVSDWVSLEAASEMNICMQDTYWKFSQGQHLKRKGVKKVEGEI